MQVTERIFDQAVITDLIGSNPFYMEAERVKEAARILNCEPKDLLKPLFDRILPMKLAKPPISDYFVTVLGLGKSGSIYTGVNLEFEKTSLNQAVHGEQFLIVNMRNHGETEIEEVVLSAAPCGYCRQFINEIAQDKPISINIPKNKGLKFNELLPHAFGPQDLGETSRLLEPKEFALKESENERTRGDNQLREIAVDAAYKSYAPYTKAISGVAIETESGDVYTGSYLENVAYNPSLSPLQAALVALLAANKHTYADIKRVVLAEDDTKKVSQEDATSSVLKSIAPKADFEVFVKEKI